MGIGILYPTSPNGPQSSPCLKCFGRFHLIDLENYITPFKSIIWVVAVFPLIIMNALNAALRCRYEIGVCRVLIAIAFNNYMCPALDINVLIKEYISSAVGHRSAISSQILI